jgi:hypothetical protein
MAAAPAFAPAFVLVGEALAPAALPELPAPAFRPLVLPDKPATAVPFTGLTCLSTLEHARQASDQHV